MAVLGALQAPVCRRSPPTLKEVATLAPAPLQADAGSPTKTATCHKVSSLGTFVQERTFDEDGMRRRAGCVCFNTDRSQVRGWLGQASKRPGSLLLLQPCTVGALPCVVAPPPPPPLPPPPLHTACVVRDFSALW